MGTRVDGTWIVKGLLPAPGIFFMGLGSWQNDTHARLRDALKQREAVKAWVDPDAPGQAVLDRNPRFGLLAMKSIFGFLFMAVGALLAAAILVKWPPSKGDSEPAG